MPTSLDPHTQEGVTTKTHYAVLSLPQTPPPTQKAIRTAYRHALLLHHPDKSPSPSQPKRNSTTTTPSIDNITTAYKTLIDPSCRREYDRKISILKPISTLATGVTTTEEQYPGLETIDLADMNFVAGDDDKGGIYWRPCRCGVAMAYEIPEKELELYAEEEEIVMQCRGCSLWLRVLFASVEVEEEEEEEEEGEGG